MRDVQGIKWNKKQRLKLELDMCFKIVWSTEIIYAKFGFVFHINLDTYVILPIRKKKRYDMYFGGEWTLYPKEEKQDFQSGF